MVVIVLLYLLGCLVAGGFVYRVRAGLPAMGRLRLFGPHGVGLGFAALKVAKTFGWSIVLVVWLARGRPVPSLRFASDEETV